jgi:hypothetical protein
VTDVVVIRIPLPEMNASVRQHLNQRIHEVVISNCEHVERLRKQSYLFVSLHQGNEDDQASMNIELCVSPQKVAAIVGNDDVVVGDRVWDKIPVLPSLLPDVRYMIGFEASGFSGCD